MLYCERRLLLQALALRSAAAAIGAPLRAYAAVQNAQRALPRGKYPENFLVHNDLPWALETRRSRYGIAPITPQSAFFVRNNLPTPPASIVDNRPQWRFEIAGTTETGSLSLAELQSLPVQVIATVLQCSGNGRAFFPHHPSGSPWGVGAAGCALWTGVRIGDVIERFGGAAGEDAEFLTTTGAEPLPPGVDPEQVVVERSVPLEKGLRDCLLVWEMNGAPLPLVHGGPLRLIVPGYYGVNNIKWVKRIALTSGQSGAHIQQSGYRLRPVGDAGGPQHPTMWRMPVKSWLNGPGADGEPVLRGRVWLHGVAFSGERGIDRVEISGDAGSSWQAAQLVGPDLGPNAWRSFVFPVELEAGRHRFVSRATDTEGDSQPREAVMNQRGYGHTGWLDPALAINVVAQLPAAENRPAAQAAAASTGVAAAASARTVDLSPLAQEGRDIFLQRAQPACGVCHRLADAGTEGPVGPNLDVLQPTAARVRAAVSQGVGAMPSFGAQLSQHEIDALAAYVAETTAP